MRDAAVSIGAGRSQLGLIEAIHARGLAVVGVDRDPAAPGLARCAAAVRASTHEPVEVIARLMALEGFRIRAVLTQSSGAPAATAARAAAALGLPGLEPRRAELSTSKAGFAELCREARVRAPETVSVADEGALLRLPPPPLVLKPARGRVGKHGVVLVRRVEELAGAFQRARAASLDGAVVAQEHVAGRDVSTVALFREGEVRTVTTLDERVTFDPSEGGGEARAAGVDVPSAVEGTPAAAALRSATAALAKRLGTGVGFFSFRVPETDGRLPDAGDPVAIEAHLDLAGDFVTDALLARGAGIDLVDLTLDLLLDGRLPAARRVRRARLSFLYEEDRPRLAELAGRGELVTDLPPIGTHGGGRIGYLLETS